MKKSLLFAMMVTSILSMGQIVEFEKNTPRVSRDEVTGHSPRAYALMDDVSARRVSYIKQSNTDVPSDKVEIILEAHKVFGDYADVGFQLLLDSDHTVYGDVVHDWSQAYYDTYSHFEYKLPEDADADENSKNVLVDGELSTIIPAGIYDFMLIYPYPGDGLMLVKGDFSRVDDFKFQGGCTYRFLIEYGPFEMPDYSGYDAVANLFASTDVALTDIVLPIKGMDFTAQEDITIEVVNRGSEDVKNVFVAYQIDDNPFLMERITSVIPAGDTVRYTFQNKADFSVEKLYEIKAWTVLGKDMITTNDTCSVKCNHYGITELPYYCDFSTEGAESLIYNWTIDDADGDNSTWMYSEWVQGVDGTYGVASCTGYHGRLSVGNDVLISVPLYFNAGDNHLIFHTRCVNDTKTERLEVAYGMTMKFEEMTPLAQYGVSSLEWVKRVINFNVPQSGVYYIAFKACTDDGYNQFIDDITVAAGYQEVSPTLRVDKVVLPYSNCDLSESSVIGAKITNIGTGPTQEFTLIYTVDYEPSVSQKFIDVLNPTESKIYYFDTTADFSEVGSYEVLVEATCGTEIEGAELGDVHHYAPITDFPMTTNFMTGENYDSYWTEMTSGTWILDDFGTFGTDYHGIENGLLSRCFALDKSVRVKIQYAKGGWETGRMYVACGKSDADVSTYKKVYEDNDITEAMEVEFDVLIDDPDNYSFVIVNTSDEYVSLSLGEMVISEFLPHDIRLQYVQSPMATLTPQVQFSEEVTFDAIVVNRGSTTMPGVKATLYHDDKLLATTSEGVDVAAGDTVAVPVSVKLSTPAVGDLFNFTVQVAGAESDGYEGDNIYTIPTVQVSDTVFATETVKNIESGLGAMGQLLSIGNVYVLDVADELSSITVGWAYVSDPTDMVVAMPIGVAVYEVHEDMTLGRKLYECESERGVGGWRTYSFNPIKLNPGTYFFEVQQRGYYNMGLGSAAGDNKCCYQNVDGALQQVMGGTLIVRANFAQDAVSCDYDAAVIEFLAPRKKATLYTSDETISVRVRNMGAKEVEFPVVCKVNDNEYTQQLSLLPYEQTDVNFEHIDLAAVGSYKVTVTTMLDGDENTANDALYTTLYSIEEANPYVMNFEHCYDFDASPDQFNPRWRTVDRVGEPTDYYWEYSHPYQGEPVGFMAFNPDVTTPVATDKLLGFYPHAGDRFGAAFCVGYWADAEYSDSWLISPQLTLSTHSALELYVKTRYVEVGGEEERYAILISDTDDNFDSFKVVGDTVRRAPQEEWTRVEVDLSEYDKKDVYVAIRYIGKKLKNVCLMVDDIMVKGDGIDAVTLPQHEDAHVAYNPDVDVVTVTAPRITMVEMYDMQGRAVHVATAGGCDVYRASVATVPAGVYVVRVTTTDGTSVTKIAVR